MYTIKADVQKNRLYIKLVGFFSTEEMKKATDDTISEVRKLKPGYDVITDVSEFKPAGPETVKEIERGQAHFKATGVGHGIRVVGESVLTGMQFNRTGKGVGYIPDAVATVEEAEKLLDSKE
jgi:hypothetical protein